MIWAALTAKVRGWLIGAGAIFGALAVAYFKGRRDSEQDQHERELNEYVQTRKRIDQVDIDDADAARRWLRERQDK